MALNIPTGASTVQNLVEITKGVKVPDGAVLTTIDNVQYYVDKSLSVSTCLLYTSWIDNCILRELVLSH